MNTKIEKAKNDLREEGFFVENLWNVIDVKDNYLDKDDNEISDDEAMDILEKALTNEASMEQIWFSINEFASDNLVKK